MAIPTTYPISMTDVIVELYGTRPPGFYSLTGLFAAADPAKFDPVYEGAHDRLSNFLGYGAVTTSDYLIVSYQNLTNTVYSNVTSTLIGAAAQSATDGAGNTVAIMAQAGHTTSAARTCTLYTSGGWYLPAIDEVKNLIYDNKTMINNTSLANGGDSLTEIYYTSSTEFNATSCKRWRFDTNILATGSKNIALGVRALKITSVVGTYNVGDFVDNGVVLQVL